MDDACEGGVSTRKMLLGSISLALYWGCALLCAGSDAACVGRGIIEQPAAGFVGLLSALIVFGAVPHLVASKAGCIVVRALILAGPILFGLLSWDPAAAHLAFVGHAALGVSLGLTLGHLGAFLAHCEQKPAAFISIVSFLAGSALYIACSPFLIAHGPVMLSILAFISALAFVFAGFDEQGAVHAIAKARPPAPPSHRLSLPKGFWPLFFGLLLYSMVYGISISLTLDLGEGAAHTTPMQLVLLAPGLIFLVAVIRNPKSLDFRRFQWFLFAPGILALLILPFAERMASLACCAVLVLAFSFFDIASFVLLVDLARGRPAALVMRVFAWGRAANIIGIGAGWGVASTILGTTLDEGASSIAVTAFIGVAILVFLMTFFGNTRLTTAAPDPAGRAPADDQGASAFREQCERVAQTGRLSARETEIFMMLVQGRSTTYIAEALVLAPSTVKTHAYRIYKKLDVHSKQELISLAHGKDA